MRNKIPKDIGNYIRYEQDTGKLYWKKSMRRVPAGKEISYVHTTGYVVFCFRYKKYKAHRVAWFLATGKQPKILDHIDGNRANNRLNNLRPSSNSMNQLNRVEHRGGQPLGVTQHRFGTWIARLPKAYGGQPAYLGSFKTMEEAGAAVQNAIKEFLK